MERQENFIKTCAFVTLQELLDLKKQISPLSFMRKAAFFNGDKRFSKLLSRGMEFEESRRYLPGDDVRAIDWKVTARAGKAHTKLFAEEKTSRAIIALDMRRSMFFATEGVFKTVQAALLAANLSWHALREKNQLSALIFTEESHLEFKSISLKAGILPFFQAISEQSQSFLKDAFQKRNSSNSDLKKTIELIKKMSGNSGTIFLISDFRHMEESTKNALLQLSKRFKIFLIFIYDIFEKELLKEDLCALIDGAKELQFNLCDEKAKKTYQNQFLERKKTVSSLAAYKNIYFMECSTKDCLIYSGLNFN